MRSGVGGATRVRLALGFVWLSLLWAVSATPAAAQIANYTPSTKIGTASLISPTAAQAYYSGLPANTTVSNVVPGTPNEITELSRALEGDPDQIYEFVRNNVSNVWIFGVQKGALGAIIDRSGTAFDQAKLMVDLINKATPGAASYQLGTISPTPTQFTAWTGISNPIAACQLLANGGIPGIVNGQSPSDCTALTGSSITDITFMHVWVRVTIGGTTYLYDPSFKAYGFKSGAALASIVGLTSGQPLAQATSGMATGTNAGVNYVSTLNATQLTSTLTSYGTSIQTWVQGHIPAGEIQDLVGGAHITAAINQPRSTSLPYATSSPIGSPWTGGIPDAYRTKLTVLITRNSAATPTNNAGFTVVNNAPLWVDEIYGRKLTLSSRNNGNGGTTQGNDILRLVDEFGNVSYSLQGPPSNDDPAYNDAVITLTVNHPYAASQTAAGAADGTYMDATVVKHVTMWMPLMIVHSWGDVDKRIVDKWGAREDSQAPFQVSPGCETCNLYMPSTGDGRREQLTAAWMAQSAYAARMHAAIAGSVYVQHHSLGVVTADTEIQTINNATPPASQLTYNVGDSFDRLDVDTAFSLTSKSADATTRRGAVLAIAETLDSLEASVPAQIADLPDTSSTATRLAWGNAPPLGVNDDAVGGGISRKVYEFITSADANAAATGLLKFEGAASATGTGLHDSVTPSINSSESDSWKAALSAAITAYVTSPTGAYDVIASEESFLGPGQRAGLFESAGTNTFNHRPTHQRGGVLIASKYNGLEPVEIAHVTVGLHDRAKGGGGGAQAGHQAQYDPSKAADVLKARFVDHSSALGVDLLHGSVSYTSPAALSVGQGEFPYRLDAQVIWRGGDFTSSLFAPQVHTSPQAPWSTNWHNTLTVSSSGIEAMGDTDVRTAAGTVAAFLVLQDIYKQPRSIQREVAAGIVGDWWINKQVVHNVITVNVGAGTQQFVRPLNTGDPSQGFISPGPGAYASLVQHNNPTLFVDHCNPADTTYVQTRGWNYTGMSFDVTNTHGDVQHFAYWKNQVAGGGQSCLTPHGFRLTTWTFPQGPVVTVNYTSVAGQMDMLASVSNNLGRQIDFVNGGLDVARDGGFNNHLTGADARSVAITHSLNTPTHTDPAGNVTTFGVSLYNGQRYLLNTVTTADSATPALTYTYDSLQRALTAKDRNAALGLHPAYRFNIAEQLRGERIDPNGGAYRVYYDVNKLPIRFIDERGKVTTATYDGRRRVKAYIYPELDQELFAYDDHNNTTTLTRVSKHPSMDAPIVTQASWDQTWNKPLTITDPKLNTTNFTYGAAATAGASLMTQALRPAPASGQARPAYNFSYNSLGQLLTSTDPTNLVVQNAYDATSHVLTTTTVDPTGVNAITTFTTDAQGDVISVNGPRTDVNDITSTQYDPLRRKVLEIAADTGNGVAPVATKTTYDPVGRVILVENGSYSGTTFTALHSLATTYDPAGNKASEVVSAGGAAISGTDYAYDFLNRVQCSAVRMNAASFGAGLNACSLGPQGSDGPDRITQTTYDAVGHPLVVTLGYLTNVQTTFETFTYNDNGTRATVADGNGNVTTYMYDGFDRVTQLWLPRSTRGLGISDGGDVEHYSYDANSNRTSKGNRDATTAWFYAYDALNRLTSRQPLGSSDSSVFYDYDAAGRTTYQHLNTSTGTGVQYVYDTAGRLHLETNTVTNRTVTSAYDTAGNRTQVTWPDNFYVTYGYDASNRVTSIKENGTTSLASFTYGPLDERLSLARGNGTSATYAYDNLGRLTGLTQGVVAGTNSASSVQTLAYNEAGQLATLTQAAPQYVWTGQPAANSQEIVNDGKNRDMRLLALADGGYDHNGNLIDDGTRTFAFDTLNRMKSATGASAPLSLTYDAGDRLTQTVAGPSGSQATTQFLYDGDNLIAEYDGTTGALLRRYVHGTGTDEPLVWYEGANGTTDKRWLLADHQGSIIGWSRPAGGSQGGMLGEAYTYGPYGEPQGWQGSRFRYTGQIALPEAQLYHYKARVYDPAMGHFLQTDPIGQEDDPNLYAYVKGDPRNHADPSGLIDDSVCTGSRVGCGPGGGVDSPSSGYAFVGDSSRVALGQSASQARASSSFFIGYLAIGSGYSDLPPTDSVEEGSKRIAEERKQNGAARDGELLKGGAEIIAAGLTAGAGELIPAGAAVATPAKVAQVTANRIAGNAFRDEIAAVFRANGRTVETEVYKATIFGKRFIDLEISYGGKVLGGIETKAGNSVYTASQRAKDTWLRLVEGYKVDVVRSK